MPWMQWQQVCCDHTLWICLIKPRHINSYFFYFYFCPEHVHNFHSEHQHESHNMEREEPNNHHVSFSHQLIVCVACLLCMFMSVTIYLLVSLLECALYYNMRCMHFPWFFVTPQAPNKTHLLIKPVVEWTEAEDKLLVDMVFEHGTFAITLSLYVVMFMGVNLVILLPVFLVSQGRKVTGPSLAAK